MTKFARTVLSAVLILPALALQACETIPATDRQIEKAVKTTAEIKAKQLAASKMEVKTAPVDQEEDITLKRGAKLVNQDGEKSRCEVVKNTGSRLGGRKICRTEAEWAEIRDNNTKEMREIQNQSSFPLGN